MLVFRSGKQGNPLLAYLTRERRPPSIGTTLFLAAIVGVVGALLMLPPFLDIERAGSPSYIVGSEWGKVEGRLELLGDRVPPAAETAFARQVPNNTSSPTLNRIQ
jgi:hypothetical protein